MKSVLILAGGGGHTGYGIILAEQLHGKVDLHFLAPSNDPLSRQLAEQYGTVDDLIKPRHPTTNFILFFFRFIYAFFQAISKVNRSYSCVVSTGSNFCIPPSIIAWIKGIPIISIESADKLTSPSKTAKYLQIIAKLTVLQWEEQTKFLKGDVLGPFFSQHKKEPKNDGYILITGGTYGYKELLNASIDLPYESVVLQVGPIDPGIYQDKRPKWYIFANIPDFKKYIYRSDVVITPPGATAMEAYSLEKSIVIITYPDWSKAGSTTDAKLFAKKLNAPFIQTITTDNLETAIHETKQRTRVELKSGAILLADYILNEF